MPKKKSDKKLTCLESTFEDILICKKNDSRPYIEIFLEEPGNIAQENLGTIAGILEVNDESEESSYIVNYLISVIKKEYFDKFTINETALSRDQYLESLIVGLILQIREENL